jgi:hypothetical protein
VPVPVPVRVMSDERSTRLAYWHGHGHAYGANWNRSIQRPAGAEPRLLTLARRDGTPVPVSSQSYPVTIAVKTADGSIEHVRVGTAVRAGDGFRLTLGDLAIGAVADNPAGHRAPPPSSDGGMVFPPYGRSKGAPIAGASVQDLEYYANGCRRTLNDPAKSRWHDKERVLLAAIEAELARQESGGGQAFGDADPGARGFDGVPPPSDDDIPF